MKKSKAHCREAGYLLVEFMVTVVIGLMLTGGSLAAYEMYKGNKLASVMFDQMGMIADASENYIQEFGVFPVTYSVLRNRYTRLPANTPFGYPYSIRGDMHYVTVSGKMEATANIRSQTRGNGVIKLLGNGKYEYTRTVLGYDKKNMANIADPALGAWGGGAWPW